MYANSPDIASPATSTRITTLPSRSSSTYVEPTASNLNGLRWDGDSVSGSATTATISKPPASTTSTPNTQCHDACSSTAAPSDGATTGATPSTSISRDSTVAAAESANRSPTTAIATTIAADAPVPCNTLPMPRTVIFGASRHTTDASMCSTIPTISGLRRPSESDSGPTISWPNASPASVPVRVNCVTDDVTDSSSVIRGNAGKYRSSVSGASPMSAPSTTIIR